MAAVAELLSPLFRPGLVRAVLATFAALNVWLFGLHGVGASFQEVLSRPALLLVAYMLLLASMAFHELGHAAACRYGGGRPGRIGVGIYLIWLTFYNDVSDSYRLNRAGRLRTDFGGVYFNAVLGVAAGGFYAVTRQDLLAVVSAIQLPLAVQQMLPFPRFDGYHVLADLVGVPDFSRRAKAILLSAVPGRPQHPAAAALKRKARVAITAWMLATMCVIALSVVFAIKMGPAFVIASWEALVTQYGLLTAATRNADFVAMGLGLVGVVFALVPLVGIVILLVGTFGGLVRSLLRRFHGRQAPHGHTKARPARLDGAPRPGWATESRPADAPPSPTPDDHGAADCHWPSGVFSAAGWWWHHRESGLLIPALRAPIRSQPTHSLDRISAEGGGMPRVSGLSPVDIVPMDAARGWALGACPVCSDRRNGAQSDRYGVAVVGGAGLQGGYHTDVQRSKWAARVSVVALAAAVVAVGLALARPGGPELIRPGEPPGTETPPVESRRHVSGQVVYGHSPPAGGSHSPIWLNCGLYDQPVPNENAVHSLEHGAVWVTYDPALPANDLQLLRDVAKTSFLGRERYIILSPYPGLDGAVVATAWGKQLRLHRASELALIAFLQHFRNGAQAPERGGRCTGGVGTPIL